jgi:hypothetical protein
VLHRRARTVRQSDQSMVRQDHSHEPYLHDARPQPVAQENKQNLSSKSRYRAFVTTERAITKLKAISSNTSSTSTLNSRRSSTPFGKRTSDFVGDDDSLYEDIHLYMYDSDDSTDQWRKVKHASGSKDTLVNSTSMLYAPNVSRSTGPPTPPPTPPEEKHARNDFDKEDNRATRKFRELFTPKPIRVFAHPPPAELDSNNIGEAIAFIGAIVAATTGGGAMSRCPVEVTPDTGLPDSWMPTAPQDTMV